MDNTTGRDWSSLSAQDKDPRAMSALVMRNDPRQNVCDWVESIVRKELAEKVEEVTVEWGIEQQLYDQETGRGWEGTWESTLIRGLRDKILALLTKPSAEAQEG